MPESQPNVAEFTVSELSAALKRTVEDAYGYVRVRGEISGYRGPHSSGHAYFALKDESAKIDAVVWRGTLNRMKLKPEEGLEVIVTGRLTTYPNRSSYQIVIETLEAAGVGALMALLEERKRKLAAEGLFDEARKQLLPFLPETIGVITSPTGAVIRDILHRLSDRFPRRVMVWPVKVQGDGAAEQVAAAIEGFNALPETGRIRRPDLLIVARGGGSLEDLWCFNEEIVVRAAARALPSAEELLAIPRQRLDACAERLPRALRANAQIHHTQFSRVAGRLSPQLLRTNIERRTIRLDACTQRLASALKTYRLTHLTRIARARDRVTALAERTERAIWTLLDNRAARLERTGQLLAAFSYRGVLSRGFALVRDGAGHPLRTAASVQPGVPLDIEFADGRVGATAQGVSPRIESPPFARPRPRRRSSGGGNEGQGSLFG